MRPGGSRPAARRLTGSLLVAALLAALPASAAAQPVTFHATDGTRLDAAWFPPPRPAPAVLLLHMLTRNHREWDAVIPVLRAAGFGVLALDYRGHGHSGGTWTTGLSPLQQDVQAALNWLKGRSDVQAGRIGIAGSSLGATLAVIGAGADPSVRSVALISPASEYRDLRCAPAMRRFAQRAGAALLIAAADDPYAVRSARALAEITPGLREVRVVEGTSAHGSRLLAARPELPLVLVDWFQRTLL